MPKFTKTFTGCTSTDVIPTDFAVGDECPDDLIAAAAEQGAIPKGKDAQAKVDAEAKAAAEVAAKAESEEAAKPEAAKQAA